MPQQRNSKPIRVKSENLERLAKFKDKSWDQALEEVLALVEKDAIGWVLPSDVYGSQATAKGEALKRTVQQKRDLVHADKPLKVFT